MAKVGRPRKQPKIPVRKIGELAALGCTDIEIAVLCELSPDTLVRNFAEYLNKGRENGKRRLRRLQLQSAKKGSVAMQIWLGKQMLNQRDRQEIIQTDDPLVELLNEFRAQRVPVPAAT